MAIAPAVSTCLWYDDAALEAAQFYVSLLDDSRILGVTRYPEDSMMPAGTVMLVRFTLAGTEFAALNGGPMFPLTEAVSVVVQCDSQAEIDRLWAALCEGGSEQRCGWLRDRYGLSWQIIPRGLDRHLADDDPARAARVMAEVMTMVKLDVAAIERAARVAD